MKVSDRYLRGLLMDVVSQRANGFCEFPYCNEIDCSPHHWFTKKNAAIKYDPDACIYLCNFHHTAGPDSAHRQPIKFQYSILANGIRTNEWLMNIIEKKNMTVKDNDLFREYWKGKLLEEFRRAA